MRRNGILMLGLLFSTLILFLIYSRHNVNYVYSKGHVKYLVRELPDKQLAADTLDRLNGIINTFTNYLYNNISKYPDQKEYITNLYQRTRNLKISEGGDSIRYTTYTVDKGKEIVFCLRSKKTNKIHDINLLTFVTIHELSHIACPEYNHTPLFVSIFDFFLKIAMELGLYKYQDYAKNPVEYCGMNLNANPDA